MSISTQTRRLMERYADGELHGGELVEAESLLSRTPALRALVADHQRLRARLRDVVRSEPVPPAVRPRVMARVTASVRRDRLRRYRFIGLAAAALFLLGVAARLYAPHFMQNPAGPAVAVALADFVRVHNDCALNGHDQAKLQGAGAAKARPVVAALARFPVALPDLAARGYALRGVCTCLHADQARVMHAHYARSAAATAEGGPGGVISLFSVDRHIEVGACSSIARTTVIARQNNPAKQRRYESLSSGDLTLLSWDEAQQTLVLCGRLDELSLRALADSIELNAGKLDYHASIAR